MAYRRSISACFGALACVVGLVAATPAGAKSSDNAPTAAKAVTWLKTQQQADGGFEVSGFAGFETPDAVLAIAEQAQAGATWSTSEALAAVQATTNATGKTPLDALDDFADGGLSAGQAAKLIALDVAALGLDPSHFDPQGDGGTTTDLIGTVDAAFNPADGSYSSLGTFNATLYAALASKVAHGTVPAKTLDLVRARQQAGGGWSFDADTTGATAADNDTTALAIEALVAGGAGATDANVKRGLHFLAAGQKANGAWQAFGADDPNSTAVAELAIRAAGFDPSTTCWRAAVASDVTTTVTASPDEWLRSQQQADGHIASPNDSFGLNTFATSQSVQGLLRSWLPIATAPAQACTSVSPGTQQLTATTPAGSAASGTEVLGATEDGTTVAGELPRTGGSGDEITLVAIGAAFVLLGTGLVAGARRRTVP
jgi:LPXTG-motif cell wall-anchored protein